MPAAVLTASGKGGTGKTLVAVNLSYALKEQGKKVGVIDADLSSPNLSEIMKIDQKLELHREQLKPIPVDDIQVFSMGPLAGSRAICMEGSQYSELLRDAVQFTEWEDIDYFVADMPPSPGDEFKRIVQVFGGDLIGTVIVMQPAHRLDAERMIRLHLDNEIPVVGLIENMSYFQQGKFKSKVFGESQVEELAAEYDVEVLGKIPLCMKIRKAVEEDQGILDPQFSEPIDQAVEKILTMKPQRPGFLSKVKAGIQGMIQKAVIELVMATNQEIDISSFQEQYGYPGGRVIRLNLMSDDMQDVLASADFKIVQGALVGVKKPGRIDSQIDIKPKALAWAVLGSRKLSGGQPYDLQDAYFQGDARVWGRGNSAQALYFMSEVWGALRQNERAMSRLTPILSKLIG